MLRHLKIGKFSWVGTWQWKSYANFAWCILWYLIQNSDIISRDCWLGQMEDVSADKKPISALSFATWPELKPHHTSRIYMSHVKGMTHHSNHLKRGNVQVSRQSKIIVLYMKRPDRQFCHDLQKFAEIYSSRFTLSTFLPLFALVSSNQPPLLAAQESFVRNALNRSAPFSK